MRWEVTAPVTSCLFSCLPPGWGGEVGAGGTLFSPGWEDCILLNVLNIKERVGFLPWSRWVRFVIISRHSVLRKHVIVWLLLGAWKAVKTEFVMVVFRCFFSLLFKDMEIADDLCFITYGQAQQNLQE